jgi:VanZ family protein
VAQRPIAPLPASRFTPRRCAGWLLLYALIAVYSSLVLGPLGFHFVPQNPQTVWHNFLATPFFDNGSDQRPDWIANLLMMVPFGLLATGALGAGSRVSARVLGSLLALLLGLGFVLAVKYAQLFFPPRTVSLNYIIAQSIGATLGVALFHPLRASLSRLATATDPASRLRLLLDIAVLGFVAFALFPFDITLSAQDLAFRFANLPRSLLSLPDAGRPHLLQIVLLVATAIAAVPLGMRLFVQAARPWHRPALAPIIVTGAALLAILFAASLFILSARVSIATFGLRLLGVVAGALLLRWLASQNPARLRDRFGRSVPYLVPIYLLLLVYTNGLLTRAWVPPGQALAGLDLRGLLPLWHDYIVSKAHALQSDVVHVAMYAPIGVLIWLRRGGAPRTALLAGTIAGLLSLAIELGRGLKPGLQPDFNEVLIGAIAAGVTNRVMPVLWPIFLSVPVLMSPDARPAMQAATSIVVAERPTAAWLPLRLVLAGLCLAGAVALAWQYPLGSWQALAALAVWVVTLWRRPALWFVLLPAIIPSLDLAPWTGWIAISEADIAVLATVAVLLLRAPPRRQDLWPDAPMQRFPRLVIALASLACLVGLLRGLSMTAHFPGGSDNPYLTWLNTLRLAKPFLSALVLLPFMRARQREYGDAALLFSRGMLVGLTLVGLAALAERIAFTGLSDIHSDFRITATFSTMHVGGGHIGAYLAFAMPFIIICLLRPRLWTLVGLIIVLPLSGYTLAMTFARTAYAATFASMAATCGAWMIASRRRATRLDRIGGALIGATVVIALIAGLNTDFMRFRVSQIWPDLATREANWDSGIDRRDFGPVAFLLGMGTGSYPRFAALRSPSDQQPGTYVVRHDGAQTYLETRFGPQFYFGQKVQVVRGVPYTLTFDLRAPIPQTSVAVSLCSKLLLFSADCHGLHLAANQANVWQHVTGTLPAPIQRAVLPAPVELSFATGAGVAMDLRNVQLAGPDGSNVVTNGDFAAGTARWFFTSDIHRLWRILNTPLSIWFEGGVLGTVAVTLLLVSALGGAANAVWRGEPIGAPIAGAMVAILLSGCFDNVFEAPRLALLFDLAAMLGLMLGWPPRTVAPPPPSEAPPPPDARIIHV